MSFVLAEPQIMASVAENIQGIGSAVSEASAAAAVPTSGVLAAAADEVSAAIASLFGAHGQEFQAVISQAQAFHNEFERTLAAAGGAYVQAETAIATSMQVALGVPVGQAAASAAAALPPFQANLVQLIFGGTGVPIPTKKQIDGALDLYIRPMMNPVRDFWLQIWVPADGFHHGGRQIVIFRIVYGRLELDWRSKQLSQSRSDKSLSVAPAESQVLERFIADRDLRLSRSPEIAVIVVALGKHQINVSQPRPRPLLADQWDIQFTISASDIPPRGKKTTWKIRRSDVVKFAVLVVALNQTFTVVFQTACHGERTAGSSTSVPPALIVHSTRIGPVVLDLFGSQGRIEGEVGMDVQVLIGERIEKLSY